jgi:hypothetical protein
MSAVPSVDSIGVDLEAFHRGLQGVDGVDLGDDDAGAKALERKRAALADVAVAADARDLAGDHDVGGALDAVAERLAAAVEVVELGLRDRVVDVDGRDAELALLQHLVEAVHTGGRLLGDALPLLGDLRGPAERVLLMDALEEFLMTCSSWEVDGVLTQSLPSSSSQPLWMRRVTSPPSSTTSCGPLPPGNEMALR